MAAESRNHAEVQRELVDERERLTSAVHDLRSGVAGLRRRLPLFAAGVVAAGGVVTTVRRLFRRRRG